MKRQQRKYYLFELLYYETWISFKTDLSTKLIIKKLLYVSYRKTAQREYEG